MGDGNSQIKFSDKNWKGHDLRGFFSFYLFGDIESHIAFEKLLKKIIVIDILLNAALLISGIFIVFLTSLAVNLWDLHDISLYKITAIVCATLAPILIYWLYFFHKFETILRFLLKQILSPDLIDKLEELLKTLQNQEIQCSILAETGSLPKTGSRTDSGDIIDSDIPSQNFHSLRSLFYASHSKRIRIFVPLFKEDRPRNYAVITNQRFPENTHTEDPRHETIAAFWLYHVAAENLTLLINKVIRQRKLKGNQQQTFKVAIKAAFSRVNLAVENKEKLSLKQLLDHCREALDDARLQIGMTKESNSLAWLEDILGKRKKSPYADVRKILLSEFPAKQLI